MSLMLHFREIHIREPVSLSHGTECMPLTQEGVGVCCLQCFHVRGGKGHLFEVGLEVIYYDPLLLR